MYIDVLFNIATTSCAQWDVAHSHWSHDVVATLNQRHCTLCCCDVESGSLKLIQHRNNVVCPVAHSKGVVPVYEQRDTSVPRTPHTDYKGYWGTIKNRSRHRLVYSFNHRVSSICLLMYAHLSSMV